MSAPLIPDERPKWLAHFTRYAPKKLRRPAVAVWDTETADGKLLGPIAAVAATTEYDYPAVFTFRNTNTPALVAFLIWFLQKKYRGCVAYAHKGMSFDVTHLLASKAVKQWIADNGFVVGRNITECKSLATGNNSPHLQAPATETSFIENRNSGRRIALRNVTSERQNSSTSVRLAQTESVVFSPRKPRISRRGNTAVPARGPTLRVEPFTPGSCGRATIAIDLRRAVDGSSAAPGREWLPQAPPGRTEDSPWFPWFLWLVLAFLAAAVRSE